MSADLKTDTICTDVKECTALFEPYSPYERLQTVWFGFWLWFWFLFGSVTCFVRNLSDADLLQLICVQLANDVLVPDNSYVVSGLVFRKQRALRNMRAQVERPRVLLLACGVEYQRVEHKFTSLENLISQVCCSLFTARLCPRRSSIDSVYSSNLI